MRRIASLVLTVVLVFSATVVWAQLPTAPPKQVGLSTARLGRLGPVFKTEVEQGKLPGAVVVVARKGKIAYFESFGHRDKASAARMTNDTIFRIYSMTKPLVSVAAMMLMEAYAEAGVYQPNGLPYDARGLTPAEQVARLARAPLAHQPGTVWEYSLASDVLGRVVESASGMPLGRFLEERLFKPLKMTDSGFFVPSDRLGRIAQPDPGNPIKLIDVTTPPKNDSGGAGGVSTAGDYLRFGQALLNGGQ